MTEPLLLAIDDVQWADCGSLLALRTLPAHLDGLPIVWLMSIRNAGAPIEVLTLADALVDEGALRVRLGPLGESAVAEVITDPIGAAPDPALLTLARRAGGSPFLLTELIRGLQEESLVRVQGGTAVLLENRLPGRISDSMRARLGRPTSSRSRSEVVLRWLEVSVGTRDPETAEARSHI